VVDLNATQRVAVRFDEELDVLELRAAETGAVQPAAALEETGGATSGVREPIRIARSEPRDHDEVHIDELAGQVTIHRDAYGVPHIFGRTDEAVLFGFAYAQAEDYFEQVEDSYILSIGRYAEVHGHRGLNSDLLNRAFEIVPRSRQDYAGLSPRIQRACAAFAAGLNHYLACHPEVRPALIRRFEPWHVLAFRRHMVLELCYRYTRLSHSFLPRNNNRIWTASGSNAWAIGGRRTHNGHPMLLANPHLPWFGFGQMVEAHLISGEGWSFTGATFYGSPMLTLGHNEHLGWSLTVNEPDIADAWRVTFDDPHDPLRYRYGDTYHTAVRWQETLRIKERNGTSERTVNFIKTHHGPIVEKLDEQTYLAANIAGLYDNGSLQQALRMVRAENLAQFRAALGMLQLPIMNVVYADCAGNIFYVYAGRIPRRDPSFDWTRPVDGSDPRTEWLGVHSLEELPQVLNPPSDYVQSCNSTPFTTTDEGNPVRADYPDYIMEDGDDDKRRARRSREILRQMRDVTFEEFQDAAFDTKVYWAEHELPRFAEKLAAVERTDPLLAQRVGPLLKHLLEWNGKVEMDSTAASLCEAWYEILHGSDYPGETMRKEYEDQPAAQLEALVRAAKSLQSMHGSWKVPYGEIHRIQRPRGVADLLEIRFDDAAPSLPSSGAHGPMGVAFTQYYTPSLRIPFVISQKKRYGIVGATYLAAYEFSVEGVRSASLVHFGQSGDPDSPHHFDQAQLLSEKRLKFVPFRPAEVLAAAVRSYRPGQEGRTAAAR
jgi:penicillin amidase